MRNMNKKECGEHKKFLKRTSLPFSDHAEICEVRTKFDNFIKNQKDVPHEFVDIINKNFWNLI